jgi:hypothetical protein
MKTRFSRTRTIQAALILAAIFTGALVARNQPADPRNQHKVPVVLELFTSEGCSSCPPADQLLESLDEKQPFSGADLIVLSEHVDYWNSARWTDPYSSKTFSARQSWYAEQFKLDEVYTPQIVIDGEREAVGGNGGKIREAVQAAARSQKVTLSISDAVSRAGQIKFHLSSENLSHIAGPATVYVALAQNKVHSQVAGGENGGRSLTHVAVVRALTKVASLQSGALLSKEISVSLPPGAPSSGLRIVALLQNEKTHKIVGATQQKI